MDNIDDVLKTLGQIADQYAPDSVENRAIFKAAEALAFLQYRETRQEFEQYVRGIKNGLTDAQRMYLESIGIDPDAEPE